MRFKNLYLIVFFIFFTPTLLNAQEYVQCEDTCSHVHGIDLSHYQGDVFWETVGENSKMAYVFRPKTDLNKQLLNFMTQCRPGEQDLIPMIDIETKSGLDTEEFCDSLFKFIHLVEKAYNQKPLLYTFVNFYNNYLLGKIDGYKLMIAQYTRRIPELADQRDFTMWQYTGKGRINGVNGFVDKSRFMDKHSLREIRFKHKLTLWQL